MVANVLISSDSFQLKRKVYFGATPVSVCVMWLRPGNLVRHKGGGPIMMIDLVTPEEMPLIDRRDYLCSCVWVEDRVQKGGTFRSSHLQTVYADGSPRNYDEE